MEGYDLYLILSSKLRELQTQRLKSEKTLPIEFPVYDKKRETRKVKKLLKKSETERQKHLNGYFKGVADAINIVDSTFKKLKKLEDKED